MRFLPTQEWSVGERGNGGVFWLCAGDNWHAACGGFYAALPHLFVRFLPAQEWSTWGREIVGDFAVICLYDTVRFLLSQE